RGEIFQQSQSMADIAGYYAAFGVQAGGAVAERPDHIVAQWEFLSELARRQASAAGGNIDGAHVCVEAQRSFLKYHAAAWVPAFFNRVRQTEPARFYARAADVAEAVLRHWCEALHVPLGPRWIELRPISEDDSSITCGAPGESPVELGPTLAAGLNSMSHAR